MHPVLARYLEQDLTRDVLQRQDSGQEVGDEHRHLVQAARGNASSARAIVRAAGKKLDTSAQQAVVILATHAALNAVREDPRYAAGIQKVQDALKAQGAEDADVDSFLAQAVADEAFGTDSDPGEFDAAWFTESLDVIPNLTKLDEEAVDDLLSDFAQKAARDERPMRERAARALLESAWSAGPSLVTAEDLEDALDALSEEISAAEFPRASAAMAEFLELLREKGLVGPLRADRLTRTARGAGSHADEDDEEDED